MSSPALAAATAQAPTAVPCVQDVHTESAGARQAPHSRKHVLDTNRVTQRDLDALPAHQTRPGYIAREVEPRLAATVVIPVYANVITGKHRGEKPRINTKKVRDMVGILNYAMAGRQSSLSANARFRFLLKKVTYKRNDRWFHAFANGPRDRQMKRKLHRGDAGALNVYFNGGGAKNGLLGWSRFPWQYASAPALDSVSVDYASIPGGRARGYNLGDTLVHETGHWLGLFHTFQGGCQGQGDFVPDTAAEAEPSEGCDPTLDTCVEPGLDPVHNFMDYSPDSCINMFTPGQLRRMDSAFEKWRL